MELAQWLSVLLVCVLGAAMPGPSLAVVMQNTWRGGLGQGVVTAVAHALGVALYAVLTVTGLVLVLVTVPRLFGLLQLAGAIFLIYLGIKTALSKPDSAHEVSPQSGIKSAWDGFLIAFLNPKLFIFFTALFSQFVNVETSWVEKVILVLTASLADGLWYCLVALLLTKGRQIKSVSWRPVYLQWFFSVVLIAVGLRLVVVQF